MANNPKDVKLIELKDENARLRQDIADQKKANEELQQKLDTLLSRIDNLQETILYLTRKLYGSSREKMNDQVDGQLSLFDELETTADNKEAEEAAKAIAAELDAAAADKPRKTRSNNAARFKNVPIEKVYLEPENKTCPDCNTPLKKIGEEYVRSEIEFHPASFKIKQYYSSNYACPECAKTQETATIIKGKEGMAHRLYGMASASTIAWVIYQKFVNSMPLYRQEKDWKQYGVDITRATLCSWVIKNADAFIKPLYDYFRKKLLMRDVLMADETPVQVLREEDRRAQTKSYMWLFRTGEDGEVPIILYKYSPTRAGETATDFLDGYSGYLMCDGYSGYNKMRSAKRLACWAHLRRYFYDAIPKGKKGDFSIPAVQGVLYCDKLFELERNIKSKHISFDSIKKARLEKEKPVLEAFWSWFDALTPKKNSKLDAAATYVSNRRENLETYLEDGRCSFSNNLSENSIRPFTVGRKNWLFSVSPEGADSSAILYSIVETAKANDINIYHYLDYLFSVLPNHDLTDEYLESVSPWNPEVKEEIQRRISVSNVVLRNENK